MLNRSASLAMSTSVLKALPGKLDIKRHSPSILYLNYIEKIDNISSEVLNLLEEYFIGLISIYNIYDIRSHC